MKLKIPMVLLINTVYNPTVQKKFILPDCESDRSVTISDSVLKNMLLILPFFYLSGDFFCFPELSGFKPMKTQNYCMKTEE